MPSVAPQRDISVLVSAVRRRIVDILYGLPWASHDDAELAQREGLTAGELGEMLDLHTTTVRFHVDQLITGGLVESRDVRLNGAGRPRKTYFAVEGQLDPNPPPGPYAVLARLLAAVMDPSEHVRLTPEEAGQMWVARRAGVRGTPEVSAARTPGAWLGKVGEVIDLLREWGYTPQLATDQGGRVVEVTLHECPFLDLARTHPDVVCGVHRGLLRGALNQVGESETDISLRPFISERTCLATLSSRIPFSSPGAPDE